MKSKLLRANFVPYMTIALRKALMKRLELGIKNLKSKAIENLRNFCSKLYIEKGGKIL